MLALTDTDESDSSKLHQLSKTFGARTWLTDEAISRVMGRFRSPSGTNLPPNILVLSPAAALTCSIGPLDETNEHFAHVCVERKDLVLAPISDGKPFEEYSGSHWSLFVAWRCKRAGGLEAFICSHFDPLVTAENKKREIALGQRMFHEEMGMIVACTHCSSANALLKPG
jgi:hypothetical protein